MGFLSWQDVININEETGSFVGKIAKKAGRQVCKWYRKYPGLWDIQPGQKGFLNQVCPPLGEPPSGGYFEWTGGQCALSYTVIWRYGNSSGVVPTINVGTNITSISGNIGPIASINTSVSGNIGTLTVVDALNVTRTATGTMPPADRIRKIFVRPPSGSIDNCGNTTDIPYPPDETIDENDFNFTITNENNTNNYNTNYNDLDFIYVRPPNITFPLNINIGGIDFKLDIDGFEFDTNPPNNDDLNDKLDDIYDKIDNIDLEDQPINLDDLDETVEEDVQEAEEEDDKIKAILIEVISLPKKGKTIILPNVDDNTFFAGYFSWTLNDYRSTELPIRKRKNVFVKPSWATGYRAYTVNLARIKIKTYKST